MVEKSQADQDANANGIEKIKQAHQVELREP